VPDVLLSTLNAKYIHAAFGLRCLLANLGELRERAAIAEFDINQRPVDIAEAILGTRPRIVGLGVYIWNVVPTTELVAILRRLACWPLSPNRAVLIGRVDRLAPWLGGLLLVLGAAGFDFRGGGLRARLDLAELRRRRPLTRSPADPAAR
jgi:hypothetical protein